MYRFSCPNGGIGRRGDQNGLTLIQVLTLPLFESRLGHDTVEWRKVDAAPIALRD